MATPSGNGNGHADAHASDTQLRPEVALVTGGSGFIGSHVVKVLLDEGVKVRVLVQPGSQLQNLEGLAVERVPGDLRDRASLDRAVAGVDTVFHLGAIFAYWLPNPNDMYDVNVEGILRLFAAAKAAGVRKVVHTSSIAAIGTLPGEQPADETTPFNNWGTADHYIMSKYMGELEALKWNLAGLPVVAVNPVFPFGSNDLAPTPTGVLVQRYVTGENPFVFRGGFNVAHVRDVARGHWLAALKGRPGERYLLGGHNITYREFADAVTDAAGVRRARWEVPVEPFARMGKVLEWVADNVTHTLPLMVDKALRYSGRFLYVDITKARTELGYTPGPWKQAIEESVQWFKVERERRLASGSA